MVFVYKKETRKLMITKQMIEDAIQARIDRFNRLYKEALGYTFEEEVEIEKERYEREMAEYTPKVEARAKELGYESEKDYLNYLWDNNIDGFDPRRDPVMQELWAHEPKPSGELYSYEMTVINEAKRIAFWFIDNYPGQETEKWKEFAHDDKGAFEFVDAIKEAGYDGWDDGHSGNSGSMAVRFAYDMLHDIELFPYEHGALCYLVGDKGYHDDRSDVHEAVEAYKAAHPDFK